MHSTPPRGTGLAPAIETGDPGGTRFRSRAEIERFRGNRPELVQIVGCPGFVRGVPEDRRHVAVIERCIELDCREWPDLPRQRNGIGIVAEDLFGEAQIDHAVYVVAHHPQDALQADRTEIDRIEHAAGLASSLIDFPDRIDQELDGVVAIGIDRQPRQAVDAVGTGNRSLAGQGEMGVGATSLPGDLREGAIRLGRFGD